MLNYIYTILSSPNPTVFYLKVLLGLTFLLVIVLSYKKAPMNVTEEGFTQTEPFVLKRDDAIYDDFYVEVYDGITDTEKRSQAYLKKIIAMTQPTVNNSVFLDVGSGTGYVVNELKEAGFKAYGVDKSEAMVEYASKKYPNWKTKHGDVMDAMYFEKSTFTHILCTYFTVYHIEDKKTFFQNCYFWMKPHGYLILHLVDREKFDTISPIGKPFLLDSPQKYAEKRITDTIVEFDDFQYKSSYKFTEPKIEDKTAILNETFTDKHTKHVRQNELALHMEDIETILAAASNAGFVVHGKADFGNSLGDAHQFIYVLERTL